MDESEKPAVKRSRFDQTEPEPKKSRFDRRSRSPANRRPATTSRERSPLPQENGDEARKSATAAAGMNHKQLPPCLKSANLCLIFSCYCEQDQFDDSP